MTPDVAASLATVEGACQDRDFYNDEPGWRHEPAQSDGPTMRAYRVVAQALAQAETAIRNHEEAHRVGLANERELRAQLAEREALIVSLRSKYEQALTDWGTQGGELMLERFARQKAEQALAERDKEIVRLTDLDRVQARAHNDNLLEMGDMRRTIAEWQQTADHYSAMRAQTAEQNRNLLAAKKQAEAQLADARREAIEACIGAVNTWRGQETISLAAADAAGEIALFIRARLLAPPEPGRD